MDTLISDLTFAVRQLIRRPGFAAVAILTIAIGIGANTAIFSLVNGVLLTPLPLAAGELVWLGARAENGFDLSVSIPNYYSWEERHGVFDSLGARRGTTFNLTDGSRPERLGGAQVIGNFFDALGREPFLGSDHPVRRDRARCGAVGGVELRTVATSLRVRPRPDRRGHHPGQRVIHGRRCHARGFFLCPRHRALGPDGDRPVAAVGVPGQQSRHLRGWATQPWRDHGAGSRGHGACRTSRPGGHRLDRDADGDAVARDFCRGHPAGVGRSLWRGRVRAAPRMCEHRKLTAGAR